MTEDVPLERVRVLRERGCSPKAIARTEFEEAADYLGTWSARIMRTLEAPMGRDRFSFFATL